MSGWRPALEPACLHVHEFMVPGPMAELSARPCVCLCLVHRVDMRVLASVAWDPASVCLGVHDHVSVCLWVSMHAPIFFCVSPCAHTFFHVPVFLYLSVVSIFLNVLQAGFLWLQSCVSFSIHFCIYKQVCICMFV